MCDEHGIGGDGECCGGNDAQLDRASVIYYEASGDTLPLYRKAGNIYYFPLHICRVALLLLRQRRGAAGNGLATTVKYLRQTTSGAAGNGLGTTIKYLRRTTSGAAGNGLGTTTK